MRLLWAMKITILIVEDKVLIPMFLSKCLKQSYFCVKVTISGEEVPFLVKIDK